ncbi:MAG: hypothetical protein AAF555_01495 [Verrucomicrobiota bacterium]
MALVPRFGWSPELSRKAVHVGLGLGCLGFPWLFSSPLSVWILAGLAVAVLAGLRRLELGKALHGVERQSLGDLLFPLGVATVFTTARGDAMAFVIPVGILALADAVGAVGGVRYGRVSYTTWKGTKSVEGSALFFLTAFLLAHLGLLLGTEETRWTCVLVALAIALLGMVIEGLLGDGWDNFVLPVGLWLVLDRALERSLLGQVVSVVFVVALFALVLLLRRSSSLDGGGLLAAVLFGYACATLGGATFLWPPLVLFAVHLVTTRAIADRKSLQHGLREIAAVAAPSLVWLLLYELNLVSYAGALAGHVLASAVLLGLMHVGTRRFLGLSGVGWNLGLAKPLLGLLLPWLALRRFAWDGWLGVIFGLSGLVGAMVVFYRFGWRRAGNGWNWSWKAVAAGGVSLGAFLLPL